MKVSSKELKRRAKGSLIGNYGLCAGIQFLLGALIFVIVLIYMGVFFSMGITNNILFFDNRNGAIGIVIMISVFLSYLALLSLAGLFVPGIKRIYLNLCTGQTAGLENLFYGFKNKPHRFLGLYFIEFLIVLVWFLPYFVVTAAASVTDYIPVMTALAVLMYLVGMTGAVVTALHLSQARFILLEMPDKKVFTCLKESSEMMRGNKGRLFWLYLSFFGIVLLGYLSLGVGFLWITPYIQCTAAEFYLELKPVNASRSQESHEDAFEYTWEQENQR